MQEPRFFNTLTRRPEPLGLPPGAEVKLYTCGPTVYDFAHIGNFRAYVFEDLLERFLELAGHPVRRVMNFTDVDDKTIRNSRAQSRPLREFTAVYKQAFLEDLAALRIQVPALMPSATDHIPRMIEMIQGLEKLGIAYQAEDKSVYYRLAKFPAYGRLAHLNLEELRPSGRVSHDEYEKESIGDFALWKARDAADGDNAWPSPWGEGRPGWHIECSAMATALLGDTVDIHCGGVDNIFPHHEAEIAQTEPLTGRPFARLWMHCEHLRVNGQKMSKSLGNFFTLRDLLAKGFTGRQIRYALIAVHYRLPLNFVPDDLDGVKTALHRLDEWVKRLREAAADGASAPAPLLEAFADALADDLNISKGLGLLFDAVRDSNRAMDSGALPPGEAAALLAAWEKINTVLAVEEAPDAAPAEVQALLNERAAARAARDWKKSDDLRDKVRALGWSVKDTAKGQELTRL